MRCVREWFARSWDLVGADMPLFGVAAFLTVAGSLLTAGVLAVPLGAGLGIMFLEKAQGRRPTLAHLGEGLSRFPAAIVVWIVYSLGCLPFDAVHIVLLGRGIEGWGLPVLALGHLLMSTALLYTVPVIADREVGGLEAVRYSWARVRTDMPRAFVLSVAGNLMLAVGVVACGVGVFITLPVAMGALVLAYRGSGTGRGEG